VLEPLKQIILGGLKLPWVTTLERMGYVSGSAVVLPLFLVTVLLVTKLWLVGRKRMALGGIS